MWNCSYIANQGVLHSVVIISLLHLLNAPHIKLYKPLTFFLIYWSMPWPTAGHWLLPAWLHPHCLPSAAKVNRSCLFCRPRRLCDPKIPHQNPHAVVQHHCISVRLHPCYYHTLPPSIQFWAAARRHESGQVHVNVSNVFHNVGVTD